MVCCTNVQESNLMKHQQLCRQQTNIEIELLGRRPIVKEDLIPSVRNLSALASLYHSVVRDQPLCSSIFFRVCIHPLSCLCRHGSQDN
jgi:hypothetical protein